MEKELPKNWVKCNIADVFEIVTGNTPSKSYPAYYGNEIPWVKPGDINKSVEIFKTEEYLSIEGFKKSRKIPKGSILVTCIGNLGNTAIAGVDLATNQQINSIVINHNLISKKYVYYYSNLLKPWLIENSTSTTISMVNKSNFEKAPFIFPPLTEQNRIVAKLDALFAQLESIKISMAKIPVLLKNFRQQVLTQAVTGKLTEEWREGKELTNEFSNRIKNVNSRELNFALPDNWIECSFDSIVQITSNLVEPNLYLDYPLITPDVIQSQTGVLLAKPLVSDILPVSPKHYFKKGDIIYSKIRPYLSKLIIAEFDGLCSADMYPISTDLNFKYLFFYMLSNEFLYFATTAGERSVLPKINQKGLNIIPIPTPSIQEQQEIVSRVESLFAKADAIEEKYKNLKAKIETLPQTILHKAFKGELTKQLETDGDAKVLLEEIAALKNGEKPKKVISKKYVQPDEEVLRIVAEPVAVDYQMTEEKTTDWYNERFELWVSQQSLAARGTLDKATLRELFDAMDDDDK